MSRVVALAAVATLAFGLFALPAPDRPGPAEPPERLAASFTVCPVIEGGGRTTEVAIASTVDGPAALTLFANGATVGSIGVSTGTSGATVIPVVDVAAVGTVGGLVELPTARSAAATIIHGALSSTLESCVTSIPGQTFLTGAATSGERGFTLHLMNPFAGDAVATLTVSSEVGLENNPRFESLIVPSRGSVVLDMSSLLPGRERLSMRVDVTAGRVVAVGRQSDGAGTAVWNAVEPGVDWFIPIPSDAVGRVVIGNASEGEVEYQVDVYGPDGVEGAALSGTIAEGDQEVIDLAEVAGARALRVVSTLPVGTTLVTGDGNVLGATTGAAVAAGTWLVPAALDGGSARVVLLNPELEDASVTVRALRTAGTDFPLTIPAEGVTELALEGADAYIVESNVAIVVLLVGSGIDTGVLTMGVPVTDG